MGCASSKSVAPAKHDGSASRAVQAMVHVHETATTPMVLSLYEGGPHDGGEAIGTGGTSSVYPVKHRETGQQYALKVISMERLSKSKRNQLLVEVDIMRTLDHPNIIRIHEVFKSEFTLYIVMEYCTGGELFDELEQSENMRMGETEFRDITKTILSALSYLHSNGIAHRDLKLENFIFTSRNKETRSLKMIDFGYSRSFLEGDVMSALVGTAFYIAPEVIDGAYTQKADLWSLGCMVYMMATGEIPIPGRNDGDVMRNVLKAKQRRVKYGNRAARLNGVNISSECVDFINNLMVVDPEHRLTARQALQHKWFKAANLSGHNTASAEQHDTEDISEVAHNISSFRKYGLLKQLALMAAVVHLQSEELNKMHDIFSNLDTDNTGTITHDEFCAGLKETSIPNSEIEKMYDAIDHDHTGHVKYAEFVAGAISEKTLSDQRNLISAFNALDIDGDGTISKSELRQLLGPDTNADVLDDLIHSCDFHQDGVISKIEFIRAMRGEKVGCPSTPTATKISTV